MRSEVKNFIYLTLILFIGTFMIASVKTVEADDSDSTDLRRVTVYTKYYYFVEIDSYEMYQNETDEGEELLNASSYYFPSFKVDNATNFTAERVCVKRDENDTTSCADFSASNTVDLDWFYNNYFLAVNEGEDVTFDSVTSGEMTVKRYSGFGGCGMFEGTQMCDELEGFSYGVKPSGIPIFFDDLLDRSRKADMISASVLPHSVDITHLTNENSTFVSFDYQVSATENGNDGVVPIDAVWEDGEKASVLYPVLYRVTYSTTTEVETPVDPSSTYDATIDYFYEGTTERVEFDDEEDNPWKKTDLEDKYTETVTSPSKKNCTPDKEKVNVSINGKDFYDVVYYACEEVENPVTGTAFIIVATVVGAGAITGAAVYYNKKVKKKEDNV